MNFVLYSYDVVTSKKNGKAYTIIHCILNKNRMYNIVMSSNEMLNEFCRNNINEDITEYINYRLFNDSFVPYINIKS